MIEPKVVIFDIETCFNIVAAFDLFQNHPIHYDNIQQERYMLSAAWKIFGQKSIKSVSLLDDRKRFNNNPHDDYHVVKTLRDELEDADAVIAHYGNKFDMPYLMTRMAYHRIDPLPKIKQIDTYQIARRLFKFNSNRLDYLGEFLGVGKKRHVERGLWLRCLNGEVGALQSMVRYNKRDISLLEDVYKVLAPYAPNTLAVVNRALDGDRVCPKCGSGDIQYRGYDRTRSATVWRKVWCKSCRGWSSTPLADNKVIR